jgi:hypothetical protein
MAFILSLQIHIRGFQKKRFGAEAISERSTEKNNLYDSIRSAYYKELFSKIKLPSRDKFCLTDMRMIPFLSKETIRSQPEAFLKRMQTERSLSLFTLPVQQVHLLRFSVQLKPVRKTMLFSAVFWHLWE